MTAVYVYKGIGHEIDQDAAWDYIRDGYLLAPRTVLKGRIKFASAPLPASSVELKNIPSVVRETLKASMSSVAGSRRAVMFSGGFDSMLMGQLAQECGAEVTAVTVQFDDFNPLTVTEAVWLAKRMGLPHHILHVAVPEFVSAFELLAGITDEPLLDLDLAVVYAAFRKYHSQIGGEIFISGMGSDQWLGNHSLEAWPGGLAGRLDWAVVNERAHQQVAQAHGYKYIFPFLSVSMLALSQQVPAAMKKDKQLLRALAAGSTSRRRGARTEIQIPKIMRRILVKVYGRRAWPKPILGSGERGNVEDQALRQIILGLWLEKIRRIADL